MQSVSNAHEVLASVDRALCVQCAMFTVPQDEGFRISGGATEFGTGRKKTAHDSDREYHFVRLDDPSLLGLHLRRSTATRIQL